MENKKVNPDLDTTRFINIDDEPFDIYINKQLARHIEPKEEHIIVLYMAQVGAKHLVDRILQKQGIRDTLRDTPLRKDLFARILPDVAEEIKVKPLTEEERQKEFAKQLKVQEDRFFGELKKRDEEMEGLRKMVEALKARPVPSAQPEESKQPKKVAVKDK